MVFRKNGEVKVTSVRCSCGQELRGVVDKCPKCGKELIPANLQTVRTDPAKDSPAVK